eukprot:4259818-Amphidinium_carterae.2
MGLRRDLPKLQSGSKASSKCPKNRSNSLGCIGFARGATLQNQASADTAGTRQNALPRAQDRIGCDVRASWPQRVCMECAFRQKCVKYRLNIEID